MEMEATGAPQKHHHTLNQQVGSITDFSAKCSDACIEKYNTGQLFGLDGIKADNPIKAKQGSSDASNY
ncbi:type IV secretion protein Rhs [Escherichia coli]|uniref:type IV secretion protein Rhs n=1 Tax=Escherichia coli TaxID=562 RepID=UPI00207B3015|nr:type IV secretion protein Rhs [Escherichia coli]